MTTDIWEEALAPGVGTARHLMHRQIRCWETCGDAGETKGVGLERAASQADVQLP